MKHLFDNVYEVTYESGQMGWYCDTWWYHPTMTYNCLECGVEMDKPFTYPTGHDDLLEKYYAFCQDCLDGARKAGKIVQQ